MDERYYLPVPNYEITATILNTATLSGAIELQGAVLAGLFMPAAFTGTTIYLQAATTKGGTYSRIQADGSDVALTVTAGKHVAISNLAITKAWNFIKLEAATAQAADRTITLALC